MSENSLDRARAAKAHVLEVFSRLAPVVGVGITRLDAGYGLKVNLRERPAPELRLPTAVDGVPVQVEVVGPIRET